MSMSTGANGLANAARMKDWSRHLGRFTEGRTVVLERLRDELRKRDYVPIVFNFDKPETKDFTETVRLLAGLSRFVIADVTNPKSAPLELQATVPEIMVPFLPIIEEGQEPFAMLTDLWVKHRDWVFEPIHYSVPRASALWLRSRRFDAAATAASANGRHLRAARRSQPECSDSRSGPPRGSCPGLAGGDLRIEVDGLGLPLLIKGAILSRHR